MPSLHEARSRDADPSSGGSSGTQNETPRFRPWGFVFWRGFYMLYLRQSTIFIFSARRAAKYEAQMAAKTVANKAVKKALST